LLSRSERLPIDGLIPSSGIKFHLRIKLPQAICRHKQKAVHKDEKSIRRSREIGMPDIKIVTEVAGRVCALAVENGASIGDGDEIAFVEAMKMEIPVTSTAAGKIKAILVKLDDVIAEGQVVAIIDA
jgi:biotin carboxyl carrier protein